ncbi:RNB-domain-containing protein [Atractiella rhizophila]|nr:RNB-domain-containing protein [Atractiella rhizophila]
MSSLSLPSALLRCHTLPRAVPGRRPISSLRGESRCFHSEALPSTNKSRRWSDSKSSLAHLKNDSSTAERDGNPDLRRRTTTRRSRPVTFQRTGKGFDLEHFLSSALLRSSEVPALSLDIPDDRVKSPELHKQHYAQDIPPAKSVGTFKQEEVKEGEDLDDSIIEDGWTLRGRVGSREGEIKFGVAPLGSWVECGKRNRNGVLLERHGNRPSCVFHHVDGVGTLSPSAVQIVIPNVVPLKLAEAVSTCLKSGTSMDTHRVELADHCRAFELDVEKEMKRISHITHETLYKRLRDRDPRKARRVTLEDVAQAMSTFCADFANSPSPAKKLAVYRHLIRADTYFFHNPLGQTTSTTFYVQPWEEHLEFRCVERWVQEHSIELNNFHMKVRQAHASRQQSNTPSLPPSPSADQRLQLSATDWILIRCLLRHLLYSTRDQASAYELIVSRIIGPVVDVLGFSQQSLITHDSVTFDLLVVLGVFQPWESAARLKSHAIMKYSNGNSLNFIGKGELDDLLPSIGHSVTARKKDLILEDAHDSVRHDFGQLRYIIIDDLDARELDDALSIEPGLLPGTNWVHVHIADPTRYIQPDHPLVTRVLELGSTQYTPGDVLSMLPSSFLESCRPSLEGRARDCDFQVALTFSGLVSETGDLLEYRIRPSILRNRRATTYDRVNVILGIPTQRPSPVLQLNWSEVYPASTPTRELDHVDDCQEDIVMLSKVLKSVARRRVQAGLGSQWYLPRANILLRDPPAPSSLGHGQEVANTTDPSIAIIVDSMEQLQTFSAQTIVQEAMVLAGSIAAHFAQEKNIPVLYRTFEPEPEQQHLWEERLRYRNPETGTIGWKDHLRLPALQKAMVSWRTQSGPHFQLNLSNGYMKVTSPLRRVEDLLAHWQLKAALLPTSALKINQHPFTASQLDAYAAYISPHIKAAKSAERYSSAAWLSYVVSRTLNSDNPDGSEANLLQNLTAYATEGPSSAKGDTEQRMMIEELGVLARVDLSGNPGFPIGSKVKVAVSGVVSGNTPRLICRLNGV